MDRDLLTRALRPLLPDLTRFCLWLTGPDAHGADLVQDVVLRALQQGDGITEPARLKSWLFRTARNAYVDTLRARAARERLVVIDGGEFESAEVPTVMPPLDDRIDLERALARMPEFARTALLLADLWEFSYEEIAVVLDIPLNTVRSRVARARVRLAALLSQPRDANERPDEGEEGGSP